MDTMPVGWNFGVLSGAHDRQQLKRAPHTRLFESIRDVWRGADTEFTYGAASGTLAPPREWISETSRGGANDGSTSREG